MQKFNIILEINNNFEKFRVTLDSIYNSFKFDDNYQIIIVSSFHKYQLNDNTLRTLDLLDDIQVFLGANEIEKYEAVKKFEDLNKNIFVFVKEGDILSENYFEELKVVINQNKDIRIVVTSDEESKIATIDENIQLPTSINGYALLIDSKNLNKSNNIYNLIFSIIKNHNTFATILTDKFKFYNDSIDNVAPVYLQELISYANKTFDKLPLYINELAENSIANLLKSSPSKANEDNLKSILSALPLNFLQSDNFSEEVLKKLSRCINSEENNFGVDVTNVYINPDNIPFVKGEIYAPNISDDFTFEVLQNKKIISKANIEKKQVNILLDKISNVYTFDSEIQLIDYCVEIEFNLNICNKEYTVLSNNITLSKEKNNFTITKKESHNALKIVENKVVREYLVSCIIPIYNVAQYLREAIDSVVNQTIGFEENVQLILINDGSSDNSESICIEYQEKYPQNVVYIEQENAGVSAARNRGLDVAIGDYISFLDGDDILDCIFFRECIELLKKYNTVNIATTKIVDFNNAALKQFKKKEYKKLEKFNPNKTNVIFEKITACLIRNKNSYNMVFESDDILNFDLLSEIAMKEDFVYVEKAIYKLRNTESKLLDWYSFYMYISKLFSKYNFKYNRIPKFTQTLLFHYLTTNNNEEIIQIDKNYQTLMKNLFTNISKDDILKADISSWHKSRMLEHKYQQIRINESSLYIETENDFIKIAPIKSGNLLVTQIHEKNNILYIHAHFRKYLLDDFKLIVKSTGMNHITVVRDYTNRSKIFLGHEEIFPEVYFEIKIDLIENKNDEISFYLEFKDDICVEQQLQFMPASRLRHKNLFFIGDNFVVSKNKCKNKISCTPIVGSMVEKYFGKNMIEFVTGGKEATKIPDPEFHMLKSDIISSWSCFSKKRIWIFMDRHKELENNAEALFRYCAEIDDGIEKWFVIPDESFKEKFIGVNTVVFGSQAFRMLICFAEKFISSFLLSEGTTLKFSVKVADQVEWERLRNFRQIVANFFRGNIIHLQHGIVFGDVSTYLNKNIERVDMLCSVCQREYEYITSTLNHSIPKENVKLTGLAKYDILEDVKLAPIKSKTIVFAPSFSRDFASKDKYNTKYKESENFEYINSIVSSKKLSEILKKSGFKFIFKPHYLLKENLCDFTYADGVEVIFDEKSRYDLYAETNLLITDYSGIQFEWAYLQKPMIYAHIAVNTKFEETYFEYDKDGFGEICYSAKSLIDTIEKYISNGCEMPIKYKKRVESFFTFNDGKNCERIYNEVLNITDTRKVVN
ncbi:MAG: CDP-glycerol glycerophosphotransferase family protein [Lachnospirales bacterium]